jgi:hypothetical protein
MSRFRRSVALLAAVGVVAVVAGCGGAGTSVSAETLTPEALQQAAAASLEQKSSRFALDFDLAFPGMPGSFAFAGEGAFDPESERATMTIDLSSLAGLMGGLMGGLGGQPDPGAPDFDDPEGWKIDAIVDGKVVYLRFPAMASELPEGKSWVRMDTTASGADQAFGGLSGFEDFASQDPRELLELLEKVSGEIETVGAEDVRGTPTTHYRATIDLRDLGKLAPSAGDEDEQFGAMFDQLFEQAGLGEMPFDVWLDEEGLVRKVQASFSMAPPGEDGSLEASMGFELYDYGVAVDVTPPPAAEVVDASELENG